MGMTQFESITVAGTAIGLTDADMIASGEDTAVLTTETAPLRYTVDGTTPTSTIGHLAPAGSKITLDSSAELVRFLAIRTTGVSASIKVSTGIGSR